MTVQKEAVSEKTSDLESELVFVSRIQQLDRGHQAALRRNAGRTTSEARGIGWFWGLLEPQQFGRNEELCFLVATLMAQDRRALEGRRTFSGDFGQSLRQVSVLGNPDGVERRFRILLDAELDLIDGFKPGGGELTFRLRQAVKLAAAQDVGANWALLLRHLSRWNNTRKWVQKLWARNFYAPGLQTGMD